MQNQFVNAKGIQQIFEKLQLILSKNEAENVLGDVRAAFNGRFECSFKDFIEFMTRKRINSTFFDKGFVDPMIAQCCQQLNKCASSYEITFEQIFDIFDMDRKGMINKDAFLKCMQGMELGIASEDLNEFFNFIDEKNTNTISKLQFVDSVTFVVTKIGGGSRLEAALSVGVNQTKKGHSVKQLVFNVLKKLSDAIQNKRLQMRQVIGIFD
jgi:Ca2+-binding EF-hand superfamily protein